MAKITYHKSHTIVENDGTEHIFVTQLYKTGVYGILDHQAGMQGSYTPQQIKKMEKNLQKQVDKGELKSLTLGIPITVSDESGLWEEVEETN